MLIILLLAAWLVVAVLGALLEGLFWLLVVGLLLFVGTAAWGWFRMRGSHDDARRGA